MMAKTNPMPGAVVLRGLRQPIVLAMAMLVALLGSKGAVAAPADVNLTEAGPAAVTAAWDLGTGAALSVSTAGLAGDCSGAGERILLYGRLPFAF